MTPTVNVALHLRTMATARPHQIAVAAPCGRDRAGRVRYVHVTYQQLDRECDRLACGLRHIDIERGTPTALMVPPSLEFFALTFALFRVGAVPVLIDPGIGVRNLGQCLAEAAPVAFVGVGKAHVARRLLGWARRSVRITVGVGRSLFCQHRLADLPRDGDDDPQAATTADERAAILFTSGSTGVAKGAEYTHGNFAAQIDALKALYHIQPGEVDLATFPLFALYAPALGMTAVVPDMDPTRPARVDPRKIVRAVEDWGVTNLFGSPALIDRVARHGVPLPTLKRAISAGAPVPARTVERFAALLSPGVELFTPYGATEALPVANIGSNLILSGTRHATDAGRGVCVGLPVLDVAVIRITDEPIAAWSDDLRIPDGDIGELCVRGPQVTRRYHGRDAATRLAKIADGDAVWHRMGDLGYRDGQGRLWFCGRKSQRVVTAAGTLHTIPCEGVFNAVPGVRRTALVGVRGEPLLCVELEAGADWAAVEPMLHERGQLFPHTKGIGRFLWHPAFPVDIRHNAKIGRERLAAWAVGRGRRQPAAQARDTDQRHS